MSTQFFVGMNPVLYAFTATLFTRFMPAVGAALVFFFKRINRKVLDAMLGLPFSTPTGVSFKGCRP